MKKMKMRELPLKWLVLLQVATCAFGDARIELNNKGRGDPVQPTEVSEELLYKKYDSNFPVPIVENVYLAWKPVEGGNPLKEEETLYYAPPQFERVKFMHEQNQQRPDGPQSRSIDDQAFHKKVMPKGPIVIPAEPKKEIKSSGYSVYGSPDINYSELYNLPHNNVKLPTDEEPMPDGREFPYLAFQRDYLSSALDSRSADTRDYPLLWGTYGKQEESALEPVDPQAGVSLQMIKPPAREKKKPTEYFYYSEESPHYKEKMSKKPNRGEFDDQNEIVSIDGIIVGPKKSITTAKPDYPEDLEPEASDRRQNVPPAAQHHHHQANAVVYSFKNAYGQKEQVGVIFDGEDSLGPQVSKVLPSNKQDVLGAPQRRHDGAHFKSSVSSSHHQQQQHGRPLNANFIPLEKKPEHPSLNRQEQAFPLGNPFLSPLLKARPEFFPAINYPPLYKIQPKKLEGQFGPAFPPKRPPDVITFPDEELPGVVREDRPQRRDFSPQAAQQPQYAKNGGRGREYVYKTVRDMDYTRPKAILQVKPSGELFMPHRDEQVEARVPILPGVKTMQDYEKLKVQQQHEEAQTPGDDKIWKVDFSDVLEGDYEESYPSDLETGTSVRDDVIFRDDTTTQKSGPPGFKFPGQSSSSPAEATRPLREIATQSSKVPQKLKTVQPNYSLVIGLTYDDDGPDIVIRDYDDDFTTTEEPEEEDNNSSKPYGRDELYDICIKEVPKHLHRELCGYIKDGKIPPGRQPTKDLQPRPSKLIQGPPPILSGQFVQPEPAVSTSHKHDPFAGIPTELPVQISKDHKQPLSLNVHVYKATETMQASPVTESPTMSTEPPNPEINNQKEARPLIFNKYDASTGETHASKPYEYFNRLTSFFNNRVQPTKNRQLTSQPQHHHPRLQRHRIRPGST